MGALSSGRVDSIGRHEIDFSAVDIISNAELLHISSTAALDAYLERAEPVELYSVRVLKLLCHDLSELGEHRLHV